MEQLPKLKEQAVYLQHDIDKLRDDNGSIANQLHDRESTIEQLNATIRALEVERDEAMFREIETEDKFKHAKITIENILGRGASFLEAVKPEPVVVPAEALPEVEATANPTPASTPSAEANAGASTQSDTSTVSSTTSTTDSSTQSTEDRDNAPIPMPSMNTEAQTPSSSGDGSTQPISDPEPSNRYSHEWWNWSNRQRRA